MPLSPGTRIGPYEITAPLGAGGMGEVYRARDAKLNRDVAIKVLPHAFAADRERVARFEREAQTLAALNHQNIAQVHGVIDEPAGLVMELVEGDDLSNRIGAGGMALEEALPIARQIADALEAAHERGIVHRDLKPANIKVREDGVVKVLDFGLAKAMDASGTATAIANSPTFMTAATQMGTILGTAAYMSPEQARGKSVDKRADIWAFGAVLFEMLSGRRPFEGETITDILGAIIHKAPNFALLPPSTPLPIAALIARCLEKDVTRRLRDIGEARVALESSQASLSAPVPVVVPAASRSTVGRLAVPLAIAAALAVGALVAMVWRNGETAAVPMHLALGLPDGFRVSHAPAISPDGTAIAYVGGTDRDAAVSLYLRPVATFEAQKVSGSMDASEPFFSPDGRYVAFYADGRLARVRVSDGTVTPIAPLPAFHGGSWGEDGNIVFSPGIGGSLQRIAAGGGAVEPLTEFRDEHYAHVWPQHLSRDTVMFRPWSGQSHGWNCRLTLTSREWSCLDSRGHARFLPNGYVLTDGSPTLGAYPPGDDARLTEAAQPLIPSVYFRSGSERSFYAVSATGTLVYVPGNPARQRIVWLQTDGKEEVILDENGIFGRVSLSPDGRRLAIGGSGEIKVIDLQRGTRATVSGGGNNNTSPMWSADGSQVIFSSNRRGKWSGYAASAANGWAETEILKRQFSSQISSLAADGSLLFTETHPQTSTDIWLQRPDGTTVPVVVTRHTDAGGRFSPDARLVAYTSNPGGRTEVFLKPLAGGETVQVSNAGGSRVLWSRKGDWLYYSQGSTIMRVAVDASGRPGLPQPVLDRPDITGLMDMSLDDSRFLAVKTLPDAHPAEIRIITHFFDELRNKVK